MKDNVMFTLLGGDMRQVHLAELLCTDGHAVQLFGLDQGANTRSSVCWNAGRIGRRAS